MASVPGIELLRVRLVRYEFREVTEQEIWLGHGAEGYLEWWVV